MNKHLQNYFDAAKQQTPLLTEKEVANLLNAAPKVVVKKRFLNLKRFVFMSTLSVMITAIWLMWNNQNVSTIKPQATISLKQVAPTQPQPNNTSGLIEKPVLNRLQLSPTKLQQIASDSLNKYNAPNKITNWLEPGNSSSYIEPQEPTREYFNENGELILTHEELAKLGIMTDGNVLSYENVVDTVTQVTIKENNKPVEKGLFNFTLKITKSGGIHTTQGGAMPLSKLSSNNLPFWCSFVEIKSNKDSSINVAEHFDYRTNSVEDFVQEIKPYSVPVRLQTKADANGKYHTDHDITFWFKVEKSFVDALPIAVQQEFKQRVDTTNMKDYWRIVYTYSRIKNSISLKSILGDTLIAKLPKKIIKLDKEGLKLLNINQKKNLFTFKCIISDNNSAHRIRLKYNQGINSYTKTIGLNSIKLRDTLIKPIALTTTTIDLRRYFYINNEELVNSKIEQKNHERFAKECEDLIPIQVTSNMVLWFRPTNYLMDVVSNHQISDNFTLEKSRLVRLTENELAKLNITYTSEGVRVPIHIDKTSSIYSVYNNYESTHDIVGFKVVEKDGTPTFEPDSLAKNTVQNTKVPTPVLITSLDGIGWRAYEYDIDKFIDPKEVAYMKEHNLSPEKHQPYKEAVEKAKQALIKELSTMLPIAIVHPTLKNTGVIAWYRTDSTLFNLLPAELAIDIKREANAITNNQQTLTCKYFETCNTAGMLYDVYAFPNPTEQMVTIEIEAMESRNYGIVLTDIEGKIVKTLTKNKTLKSGKHQLPFDLADMAPGMYLLQVNTQYNELTVKRIIKK